MTRHEIDNTIRNFSENQKYYNNNSLRSNLNGVMKKSISNIPKSTCFPNKKTIEDNKSMINESVNDKTNNNIKNNLNNTNTDLVEFNYE